MRETLFRAKEIDNNEWVYGNFIETKESYSSGKCYAIISNENCHRIDGEYSYDGWYEVDKNTLGQFTGLTDKNGKKIFIGDIVELFCKGSREHKRYEVFYDVEIGQLLMRNGNDVEQLYGQLARNNLTVVGNIYDNPELLEERK